MRPGALGHAPGAPAAPVPAGPAATPLRDLHLAMLDAVLSGEGLTRVAQLAAEAAGGTVAVVVPRLDAAACAPADDERLEALRERVAAGEAPGELPASVPIRSGDETIGLVALLEGGGPAAADVLGVTSLAAITEVAIAEARDEVADNLRGSFLEDLRGNAELEPAEVLRRAGRLGCDLARGAIALCAELDVDRPRHVVAMIAEDAPGALAQHLEGTSPPRVLALLPADGGDDAAERVLQRARRVASRLGRHGTVGVSTFHADPATLGRALDEAELVLDVVRRSGRPVGEEIGSGTYRLLFRVLASHPEEVAVLFDETVAPIVAYDDQYRTDLVGTLDAYLRHNCNMNATAAAIFAHRHTVAYRLERVKELTGLDPAASEDRERLGLGLKAHRLIAPRLPR